MFEVYFLAVLGLSVWGIASAIGVLRLHRWGRVSAVMASAIMLLPPALSIFLWILTEIVLLRDYARSGVKLPRMTLLWAILWFLLPLWWLILFTRPSVKRQFTGQRTATDIAGVGNEGGVA